MAPDQLIWIYTVFNREYIWFQTVFKRVNTCLLFNHIRGETFLCIIYSLGQFKFKHIRGEGFLCIICSLGQVKLSSYKYHLAIYLCVGKYQFAISTPPASGLLLQIVYKGKSRHFTLCMLDNFSFFIQNLLF